MPAGIGSEINEFLLWGHARENEYSIELGGVSSTREGFAKQFLTPPTNIIPGFDIEYTSIEAFDEDGVMLGKGVEFEDEVGISIGFGLG